MPSCYLGMLVTACNARAANLLLVFKAAECGTDSVSAELTGRATVRSRLAWVRGAHRRASVRPSDPSWLRYCLHLAHYACRCVQFFTVLVVTITR